MENKPIKLIKTEKDKFFFDNVSIKHSRIGSTSLDKPKHKNKNLRDIIDSNKSPPKLYIELPQINMIDKDTSTFRSSMSPLKNSTKKLKNVNSNPSFLEITNSLSKDERLPTI